MAINCNKKIIKAFTLAEVLITLGIIGIVAAILIPTIQENIQKMQFKEAAKEAFSKSSQVVQQMKMDEGGTLDYYFKTDNSFKPDFMKHFKTIKDCGLQDCIRQEAESNIYKTLTGEKANTSLGGEGQFITADGMFFNIQNTVATGLIIILIDVNGYTKKPNVYGQDTFIFELINDKLYPMGTPRTSLLAPNYCNRSTSNGLQGTACMYYVIQGKDY